MKVSLGKERELTGGFKIVGGQALQTNLWEKDQEGKIIAGTSEGDSLECENL